VYTPGPIALDYKERVVTHDDIDNPKATHFMVLYMVTVSEQSNNGETQETKLRLVVQNLKRVHSVF
jgi:hypothetical protein